MADYRSGLAIVKLFYEKDFNRIQLNVHPVLLNQVCQGMYIQVNRLIITSNIST